MAMHKQVLEGLNQQLNKEFESAYLYLALSSYFEEQDYDGFAEWLKIKAKEEMLHAMKIYDYLSDRNAQRHFMPIPIKTVKWKSPSAAMDAAYKHECGVSESIHNILALARQHKDYSTEVILHWFINEQIEEEAEAEKILHKVKMVEKSSEGMFMLDNYMAALAKEEAAADTASGGE